MALTKAHEEAVILVTVAVLLYVLFSSWPKHW